MMKKLAFVIILIYFNFNCMCNETTKNKIIVEENIAKNAVFALMMPFITEKNTYDKSLFTTGQSIGNLSSKDDVKKLINAFNNTKLEDKEVPAKKELILIYIVYKIEDKKIISEPLSLYRSKNNEFYIELKSNDAYEHYYLKKDDSEWLSTKLASLNDVGQNYDIMK
jgi:hypothetical protein